MIERHPNYSDMPLGIRIFKIFIYAWPIEMREEFGEECLATDRLILAEKQGLDKTRYIMGNCWGFITTGIELRLKRFHSK